MDAIEIANCPVLKTFQVIGGKWKLPILYYLKGRPRRFNELRRLLPDITQRMLTLQLRALERDGVVVRTVHERVPPHVDYALSGYGWTLGPILDAMEGWGEGHFASGRAQVERREDRAMQTSSVVLKGVSASL